MHFFEIDGIDFVEMVGPGLQKGKRVLRWLNRHKKFHINNDEIELWKLFWSTR